MEQLSQKKFNGIMQVSKATFDSTESKEGFLWFVKDAKANGIYFGSQLYATTDASSITIASLITDVKYDTDTHELVITWKTESGEIKTRIDLSNLVDIYHGGQGILIDDDANISIKINPTSSPILKITDEGLFLSEVDGSSIKISRELTNHEGNPISEDTPISDVLQQLYDAIRTEQATSETIEEGHVEILRNKNGELYGQFYYADYTE